MFACYNIGISLGTSSECVPVIIFHHYHLYFN